MGYDRKTMEIPIMMIMEWREWNGIPRVLAAWPVLRCLWYKWWIFCCQLGCLELYVVSSGIFMLTTRQMLRVVLGKWTVGCIVHACCQIWWCNLTMSIRGSCPHALSGKTFMTFQLFRFIYGDTQGRKESQIQNFANLLMFLFIQGLIESWIFFCDHHGNSSVSSCCVFPGIWECAEYHLPVAGTWFRTKRTIPRKLHHSFRNW